MGKTQIWKGNLLKHRFKLNQMSPPVQTRIPPNRTLPTKEVEVEVEVEVIIEVDHVAEVEADMITTEVVVEVVFSMIEIMLIHKQLKLHKLLVL